MHLIVPTKRPYSPSGQQRKQRNKSSARNRPAYLYTSICRNISCQAMRCPVHNRQFSQHFGHLFVCLIDLAGAARRTCPCPWTHFHSSSPPPAACICQLFRGCLLCCLAGPSKCARVCVNILQNFTEFFACFSPGCLNLNTHRAGPAA